MKKTARNILIMVIVLAVLGGAAFLLLKMPQEDAGGESSSLLSASSEVKEAVLEIDEADVESIQIKNSEDAFTLIPEKTAEAINFTLEDCGSFELNTEQISSNARTVLNLSASKNLGSQENLSAFGLDSQGVQVTINQKDGSSDALVLGNEAGESAGRYVLKDGTVYIVAGVPANFYGSKFEYFNLSVYTVADRKEVKVDEEGSSSESTGIDILYSIAFSGAQYPDPIAIEFSSKSTSQYLMTQPVVAESGNTAFNEMMASLKTLTASGIADVKITPEKLEKYGLTEPDAEIAFHLNDSEHKLAVSAKDSEGYRYMIADDKDIIYRVANGLVNQWAETDVVSLRMSYIWIPNIQNVEKLTVTLNGDEVREYHVTRTLNEEKSSETSKSYNLAVVDGEEKPVDYEESYQPFYQKLIGLAVFSQEEAAYQGTPALRVDYEYFDGGKDVLELYVIGSEGQNRYAAVFNGDYNGQVRGGEVRTVLEMVP